MQRPSEANEYSKSYGAMAADAVLDPANLAGLDCLLRKIFLD
jgi:hypothetical protein